MKINAKTEQMAVTKPALDFSGCSCVTGDALREVFSLTGGSFDGGTTEFSLAAAHILTSEICDLSQPKMENLLKLKFYKKNKILKEIKFVKKILIKKKTL